MRRDLDEASDGTGRVELMNCHFVSVYGLVRFILVQAPGFPVPSLSSRQHLMFISTVQVYILLPILQYGACIWEPRATAWMADSLEKVSTDTALCLQANTAKSIPHPTECVLTSSIRHMNSCPLFLPHVVGLFFYRRISLSEDIVKLKAASVVQKAPKRH